MLQCLYSKDTIYLFLNTVRTIYIYMNSTFFPQDVTEYWPEVKDDLSKVKWSHATNSEKELNDALTSKVFEIIFATFN